MSWTEERTHHLQKLFERGLSPAMISRRIGGVSRNAVIGKLYRMGLSKAKRNPRKKSTPAKQTDQIISVRSCPDYYKFRAFNPKSKGTPTIPYKPEVHVERSGSISFDELTSRSCRFPVGEATGSGQMYCGRKSKTGLPYCKEHHETTHTRKMTRGEHLATRGAGSPKSYKPINSWKES